MPILQINDHIDAPPDEVYRHVTLWGENGPTEEAGFVSHYGEIVERDGGALVIDEDVSRYPDDPPDIVRWRCFFDFPKRRQMVAVDSTWADREDIFTEEKEGTRWRVRWRTKIGGIRGALQIVYFWLVQGRAMSRDVFGPVKERFPPPT